MKDIRIHFDKHNLFEVALVAGVLFALWHIRDFILVLAVALILSTFIEDFVQIAKKRRIPRIVSVISFYLLAIVVLVAALIFLFLVSIVFLPFLFPCLNSVIISFILNSTKFEATSI